MDKVEYEINVDDAGETKITIESYDIKGALKLYEFIRNNIFTSLTETEKQTTFG